MNRLLTLALFLFSSHAFALEECRQLAEKAARSIYMLSDHSQNITKTHVEMNENNTSSGASFIVTFNGESKYLAFLTPAHAGPTSKCRSVNYVIAYPYADLMPQ